MRPGWGMRHPEVEALLRAHVPSVREEAAWGGGSAARPVPTLRVRLSSYLAPTALPETFLTSVRCIVFVGDRVVMCENLDGCHPWPGGRREPDESHAETACREVHEETGWWLDPSSLREVGWLHVQLLDPQPEDHPWPHPDVLQVVYVGWATGRDDAQGGDWTDTEGWELGSSLLTIDEALARSCLVTTSAPFLELVRDMVSGPGR